MRNPGWWDKPTHNIERAELNIIANDATRVAALLSGEVDFVYTVPPQDVARIGSTAGVRIIQGPELRTIYFGMDQLRPELLKCDVKGKNPFQDVRVRKAVYQAIDVNAIQRTVMRGQSQADRPDVGARRQRLPARRMTPACRSTSRAPSKLLAEAGYPNGFGVTMDCPNDRYVNDEAICTAAVAMLARIGVRVTLNAQTRARFFAEVNGAALQHQLLPAGLDAGDGRRAQRHLQPDRVPRRQVARRLQQWRRTPTPRSTS